MGLAYGKLISRRDIGHIDKWLVFGFAWTLTKGCQSRYLRDRNLDQKIDVFDIHRPSPEFAGSKLYAK